MKARPVKLRSVVLAFAIFLIPISSIAQDAIPEDNGLATYHTAPRYRESESHPLRVLAYVFHPVGWVFREVIFRPLSYFAGSTETTRSVMGFREPYDYRQPECFSADSSSPDCRTISPFNYDATMRGEGGLVGEGSIPASAGRSVYFPDVNYDFDSRKINTLGKGKARQIANQLKEQPGMHVVLEGHADYIGSDPYNEKLGLDRADALRQELAAQGVSAERLSTVTFGKTRPALPEQDDPARAVNRRVEVHASEVKAQMDPVPYAQQ